VQNLSFLVGHSIQILESVDSTNNYIAKYADEQKMAEGTVIMAKYQSKGKGRMGKHWKANANENLTFSFLLHPKKIDASQQFSLNKWVCSAICMWLQEMGLKPTIKLPNDIFIGEKKICGILIENTWIQSSIKRSIIGIGINLNQMEFEGDYAVEPTSILYETGNKTEPKDALNKLVTFLSYYYSVQIENPKKVEEAFHYFLGLNYEIMLPKVSTRRATLISVENSGDLNFQLAEGNSLKINLEEVKLRLLH